CDVGLAPSEVDDAPVNTKDNVYLDTQHTHTLTNDKKSLTDVVDWDAIRHKYWERKGKIKQTGNDIIAALGRATSYTERGGQDRPNLNGGIHRNDMNSNLPHTVVYDNEAFDAHK
uniref:Uncharacterized protein n=2 Tax=Ciona intestinalis TaxID=7719 RepID=H2XXN9_CIOIN